MLMPNHQKQFVYVSACGQNITVFKKKGIKRLSMRFSFKRMSFIVTSPLRFSKIDILKFIDDSRDWIGKILIRKDAVEKVQPRITPGQTIQLLGIEVQLQFIQNCQEKVVLNDDILTVYGVRSKFENLVKQYFKNLAYEKLSKYSHLYATQLGVIITKISVKEMTTRFGSCTTAGNLNYCWRIIFAPEAVLAYLCAHEVAHLKEMNHSKKFWAHVEYLCPNYLQLRKWLKQHGKTLFEVSP